MATENYERPISLLDNIYPVGSIYMNTTNIDPAVIIGGTWERITGKFLYGAEDSGIVLGDTGGSATHTLITAELPSHNHSFTGSSATTGNQSAGHTHTYTDYYASNPSGTAITVAQLASHSHKYIDWVDCGAGGYRMARCTTSLVDESYGTRSTGSSNAHTHTAQNTSATRTSNGISANHTHNVTAAGSIGNTGSGQAFSILPPYIAVYIWRRTA